MGVPKQSQHRHSPEFRHVLATGTLCSGNFRKRAMKERSVRICFPAKQSKEVNSRKRCHNVRPHRNDQPNPYILILFLECLLKPPVVFFFVLFFGDRIS